MSRQTGKNFQNSFRVVFEWEDGKKTYEGPYQTIGAARGRLTQGTEGWYAEKGKTGYVEQSTGWEKV